MDFIIIFGPPAVGKMTVGRELAILTGMKLFHNHMTIELILEFFDFGTPKFGKLNAEFRRRIFEEVATSDVPGLIFTYVWGLGIEAEKEYVDKICAIFKEQGAEVFFVELYAEVKERLIRNKGVERLTEKKSKRNEEESEKRLLETDKKYKMNTEDDFYYTENYIKINNTKLSAREVAEIIVKEFNFC